MTYSRTPAFLSLQTTAPNAFHAAQHADSTARKGAWVCNAKRVSARLNNLSNIERVCALRRRRLVARQPVCGLLVKGQALVAVRSDQISPASGGRGKG